MQTGDVSIPDGAPPIPDELQDSQQQYGGGILRKKLYDQNLSDWSARYRKNKQNLDALMKDCELLRIDVGKSQREVDERAEGYKQLEEKFGIELLDGNGNSTGQYHEGTIMAKYQQTKNQYEAALRQKEMLSVQISENRKHKSQLTREKKMLTNDYERKHAELMRMAEVHDKLDGQLSHLTQQLGQLTSDRRRMERELDEVQHNLRANTELADEVTSEISHVQDGIKDSMDLHMAPAERMNTSTGSIPAGSAAAATPGGEM